MSCYSFDSSLKSFFGKLGRQVGKTPGYFIIGPLLLTGLAATGLYWMEYTLDVEYLTTPINGRAKIERAVQERHFPQNFSDFDPLRISSNGKYAQLIIEASDGETILREGVFNKILVVDDLVRRLTFWSSLDQRNYSYADLCAKEGNNQCYDNKVLNLGRYGLMADIESGKRQLSYPVHLDTENYEDGNFVVYTFPFSVGGIQLSEDQSILLGAKAIKLIYFLDSTADDNARRAISWEISFQKLIEKDVSRISGLKVSWITSSSLAVEFDRNAEVIVPYFCYSVGPATVFNTLCYMSVDWVRSKPALGLAGLLSPVSATVTAFGLCMYIGVPFYCINLAALYLMLGIGVDDIYIFLAAWQRTSAKQSVPERMAQVYQETAASITITSLTDTLSFLVGIITPIPAVRIFCIYISMSIIFTYFWHITFFGGLLSLAGYVEKANKHSLTGIKVLPRSLSDDKGKLYKLWCSGGINKDDPDNQKDNGENTLVVFFKDYYAFFINLSSVKACVIFTYIVYVIFSGWAISNLKEGLEYKHFARYDSYTLNYYKANENHFNEFSFGMSVMINETMDYSDKSVQQTLEKMLSELEGHPNVYPKQGTQSWLRDFLDYAKSLEGDPISALDITNEEGFVKALTLYSNGSDNRVAKDVHIENNTIIASRFIVIATNLVTTNEEKDFVVDVREIIDKYPFQAAVFNPKFLLADLFIMVVPSLVQLVAVAAVAMLVVCLVFIPNPLCSLWVTFSIISIEAGVLGFMTLWNVKLDIISMILLVMCIGFSVDFSAHISYHFMQHQNKSPEERVRECMYALGLPILQGAISTSLGVLGLAFTSSYIFETFFKMTSLAVMLGVLHGIVFLPVLLSIMGPGVCKKDGKENNVSLSKDPIEVNDSPRLSG